MGAGKEFLAALLPFWEKGLGAEGKPAQSSVSPTFAEWIAPRERGSSAIYIMIQQRRSIDILVSERS
jgi:hypothetical protein